MLQIPLRHQTLHKGIRVEGDVSKCLAISRT